jgi:hypothetical protein
VTSSIISTPDGFGPVLDVAPTTRGWLALTASGALLWAADGSVAARRTLEPETGDVLAGRVRAQRLHASADGGFAAVVNDYGRYGQVIDLETGSVTVELDGGDYFPDTVPFSFAFDEHGGRTVAIHRTAWNRLDATDAATGERLTDRPDTTEDPLDYFHGALYVSPGGDWLLDDGWVWHPIGVPIAWNLRRWLTTNPDELDADHPWLCTRDYHWDVPMCWLDASTAVISGLGHDDDDMPAGVILFDAATRAEIRRFEGPRGALFADGRHLYAAAPDGLETWDPSTGRRIGQQPGFVPSRHDPATGSFAAVEAGVIRIGTGHRLPTG